MDRVKEEKTLGNECFQKVRFYIGVLYKRLKNTSHFDIKK